MPPNLPLTQNFFAAVSAPRTPHVPNVSPENNTSAPVVENSNDSTLSILDRVERGLVTPEELKGVNLTLLQKEIQDQAFLRQFTTATLKTKHESKMAVARNM